MEEFKKLSLFEKRNMAIEELVKYYAEYRKYEFDLGKQLEGIELRKRIHFLIKLILEIDKTLSKEKIVIVGDKHY